MKYLSLLLVTFSHFVSAQTSSNINYTVPKIEIENRTLIALVQDYCKEEIETFPYPGVLALHSFQGSNTFYITHQIYVGFVRLRPPTFYSAVDGKIVVIYTGFEHYLKFDYNSSLRNFLEDTENLFVDVSGVLYHPVIWKATISEGGYTKEVVFNVPGFKY